MVTIKYEPEQHRLTLPTEAYGQPQLLFLGEPPVDPGETFELKIPNNLRQAFPSLGACDWYEIYTWDNGRAVARRVL